MIYTTSQIIRDARIAMRLNPDGDAPLLSMQQPQLTADAIILSKIETAAAQVVLEAPLLALQTGHNFGDAVHWEPGNWGWTPLPDDFLRLIAFQMDDWERPVTRAISCEDAEYRKQRLRHAGLRGTPQRPVCSIVMRPEGRVLEFYSCRSQEAMVSTAVYAPLPRLIDSAIDLPPALYSPLITTLSQHF